MTPTLRRSGNQATPARRPVALATLVTLIALSACQADAPAPPTIPELPEGTPEELLVMSEDRMRRELVEELGLEQVLTEEVFAEMDAARDRAALEAFPELATAFEGGAVETSIELASAVVAGGSAPPGGADQSMRLVLQRVPTGEYGGAMIGTGFLAAMWARSQGSADIPTGDESSRTVTEGGVTSTVSGSYGVEGTKLVADVTVTTQKTVDGQPYTEVVHVTVRGDACPDADGKLSLELKLEHSLTGGGATATRMWDGTITAHVGDDAWLKTVDFDVTTSGDDSTSGAAAPAPRFGWSATTEQVSSGLLAGSINLRRGAITWTGAEGLNRTQAATAALRAFFLADSVAERVLPKAQDHWRNGGCVIIEVPEGTKQNVGPNETRPFTVHVKQKWEGVDVPVKVTVTEFRGKEGVEPREIDPAPDRFTITAGADGYASVVLETVSRRGRDTEGIEYTVRAAYRIVGGLDYFQVDQVVCDITRTFRLQGSGITMRFHPNLDDRMKGTYEYSGSFAGVKAKGSGTYVVKADETGGTMVGKGKGSITSPLGTFTGFGTERYTLTPATC